MNDSSEQANRPSVPPREHTVRLESSELDDYLQRIRRRLSTRRIGTLTGEDPLLEAAPQTHSYLQAWLAGPIIGALRIISGPYARQWIILTEDCDDLSVGRSRESTLEMSSDPLLSRTHFIVRVNPPAKHGEGWCTLQIIDSNSTNGTFINGQKLAANEPAFVQSGDMVNAGSSVFEIILYDVRPRFERR